MATGVSIWNSIAPEFEVSFSNIDTFMAAGRQHGILGLINTLWTDDILVLMRPAFPGIAYGAAAAWQHGPMNRDHFFSDYARIVYPASVASEVAPGLAALLRAEVSLSRGVEGGTMRRLWDDPFFPPRLGTFRTHRDDLRQARLEAEEAQDHLSQALQHGGDHFSLGDLLLEARMLDYAAMKALYAAEIADFWQQLGPHPSPDDVHFYLGSEIASHDHSRLADLMDAIADLRTGYQKSWDEAYTPYRRGTVLARFEGEFQYWWNLQRRVNHLAAQFHKGDSLPPVETLSTEH